MTVRHDAYECLRREFYTYMKRTQVLRSIGYTYSAPPTPTNAANMKAREHEYAPVRDRAPLITSLAHRAAHYLAQIEPYARMMPLLM